MKLLLLFKDQIKNNKLPQFKNITACFTNSTKRRCYNISRDFFSIDRNIQNLYRF